MSKPVLCIVLLLMLLAPFIYAQDSSRVNKEWANIGYGFASDNIFNGIKGLNIGVNYNRSFFKKNFYQVGFNFTSGLFGGPSLYAINFSIGKRLFSRYYLASGFLGPSMVGGINEIGKYYTIGLTSMIQLIFKPLRDLGAGIELYTNLSIKENSTGIRVVLHLSSGK